MTKTCIPYAYKRTTLIQTNVKKQDNIEECLINLNEPYSKSQRVEGLKLLTITFISSSMLAVPLPLAKQVAIYGCFKNFDPFETFKTVLLITGLSTIIPKILNTKALNDCSSQTRLTCGTLIRHVCLWPVEQNMLGSLMEGSSNASPFFLARVAHCCREALTLKCDTQNNNCNSIQEKCSSYFKLSVLQALCEQFIIPTNTRFYKIVLSRFLFLLFLREVIKLNSLLVTTISNYITTKVKN